MYTLLLKLQTLKEHCHRISGFPEIQERVVNKLMLNRCQAQIRKKSHFLTAETVILCILYIYLRTIGG